MATASSVAELQDLPPSKDFYEQYIQPRRPVVFRGCLPKFSPKLATLNNIANDLGKLVDGQTMIEVNESETGKSFSPADSAVKEMSFQEFLKVPMMSHDDDKGKHYYMTTQTLPPDDEGRPALYTSPVKELLEHGYMELRPDLWGNLIPMTYNLWMGNNTNSSSSGLHHDYHDNLYCLIQGTKHFRIAPPETVQTTLLKMQGTLHKLHSNGRIVYKEQLDDEGEEIRPDGALEGVERLMTLESRKEFVEKQIGLEADETVLAALEEELDTIEEEMLEYELGNQGGDGDDASESGGCNLFGGAGGGQESDRDENSASEDETPLVKKQKLNLGDSKVPSNFCLQEPENVAFQNVSLQPGDLLYLPAGWFHEVRSQGGLHVALNYWMHPPDVGDDVSFEEPYRSQFWKRDWALRGLS